MKYNIYHILLFYSLFLQYYYCYYYFIIIERSLEVKLPTIWTDEKQGRGREKRKIRRKKSRRDRVRRKKMEMREKVGKSRKHCVFPMICGSRGWKSRLAKAVGAEPARDERWKVARRCGAKHISKSKCTKHTMVGPLLEVAMSKKRTPLWREAHFQVKMYKAHHGRTTFGSCDVEKVHAVVARSTFPSQNVQSTPWSDHFWKLRCRKSARRCGANHISKSKCAKHTIVGPLLEVAMSKKCTPLWREAHFQVKMYKTPHVRATFGGSDVEKVHTVVVRSTFPSENVQNARGFGPLLEVQMSLRRFASLHYTTLHYNTPLYYTTLHYTPQHYNYNYTTTLHYTPLH